MGGGGDSPGAVFAAIWSAVAGRQIERPSGIPTTTLKYYTQDAWTFMPGAGPQYQGTRVLLYYGQGRCQHWAEFFHDLCGAHGIEIIILGLRADGPQTFHVPYKEQQGIPGQGVGDPGQKYFPNHAVCVRDTNSDGGYLDENAIYDPSYGLSFVGYGWLDAFDAFEEAAVEYYSGSAFADVPADDDSYWHWIANTPAADYLEAYGPYR